MVEMHIENTTESCIMDDTRNFAAGERMMNVDRKAEVIAAIVRILNSASIEQLEFIYQFVLHHVK